MSQPDQIDLNDLPIFVALVETGSFTAAADRLGCAKTRVSVVIKRLEQRLGVNLFNRTTRRVQLTEAGAAFYRDCNPLLSRLEQAIDHTASPAAGLTGELRVTAPEDYAAQFLVPAVAAFRRRHPDLKIELRTGDQVSNVVAEGIDIGIRLGWLRDSSLRATRLGKFEQWVITSPDYLHRHGTPRTPDDLANHQWIAFSPLRSPLTWTFTQGLSRRQVHMHAGVTANATGVLRSLLLAGEGISVIAEFSAHRAIKTGRLIRLLPDWSLPDGGVHAVFPPGRYLPAKVRLFVEFLRRRSQSSGND